MKCTFYITKECIKPELFEKWKDDKRETAFITLGVCPSCPLYHESIDIKEVKDEAKEG